MKFSIVTPTYNAARYIEQAISSVVRQQGDFDIEYFIVDNESTDDTLKIATDFMAAIDRINVERCGAGLVSMSVVSSKDAGMYEAINRGFLLATGDIFAWINSDDIYLPEAFSKISRVFSALPEVRWLKGRTAYIDEDGRDLSPGRCYLYAQDLLRSGLYGKGAYFVQQDSVFWRADLWTAAGGLDESFRLAGDYDLWVRFAEHESLYSLDCLVSCFRRVSGQLSENLSAYREEQKRVVRSSGFRGSVLYRFFQSLEPKMPDWINSLVFRVLCPFDPLYLVDVDAENVSIRKSFKYKV